MHVYKEPPPLRVDHDGRVYLTAEQFVDLTTRLDRILELLEPTAAPAGTDRAHP